MFEPIHGSAFDITGMGVGESLQQCAFMKTHCDLHDLLANLVAHFGPWLKC